MLLSSLDIVYHSISSHGQIVDVNLAFDAVSLITSRWLALLAFAPPTFTHFSVPFLSVLSREYREVPSQTVKQNFTLHSSH